MADGIAQLWVMVWASPDKRLGTLRAFERHRDFSTVLVRDP